jgi:hypothetical protein
MGGLEPPIHPARVGAPGDSFALADASAMGGRVKPGHDEDFGHHTNIFPSSLTTVSSSIASDRIISLCALPEGIIG